MLDIFERDIWSQDPRTILAFPYRFLRILYLSGRGFRKDHCVLMATNLTYISLLSIVPLLAFAFSVSKGLKAQNVWIRDWVDNELSGALQEVMRQILARVEEINVTALGTIGFVILILIVMKMVGTVERSFNVIWGVRKGRSFVRKITDYVSMVVLGPIFLITIVGLTSMLTSNVIVERVLQMPVVGELRVLRTLTPYVIVWIGFSFLYLFLPNTRVRILAAILAGITAGTMWEAGLKLYIWSQVGVAKYTALYGAFAAIPIFLVWVNLSWMIVLVGAELCFAIQNETTYLQEVQTSGIRREQRESLALHLLVRVAQRFEAGERAYTAAELSDELDAPIRLINEIAGRLVDGGCLEETRGDEANLVPARDPNRILVRDILEIVGGDRDGAPARPAPSLAPPASEVEALLERLQGARDKELGAMTLADLAARMGEATGEGTVLRTPDRATASDPDPTPNPSPFAPPPPPPFPSFDGPDGESKA